MQAKYIVLSAFTLLFVISVMTSIQIVYAQTAYAGEELDLASAQRVLNAALEKASEQGTKMNVTILDAGGHLKAFARMEGAYLGSIDVSMKKAKASILFQMPSGKLGTLSQPGGDLFGIEESNDGLISFAGGVPIVNKDGVTIGAIGVSGSSLANDLEVAEAGAEAYTTGQTGGLLEDAAAFTTSQTEDLLEDQKFISLQRINMKYLIEDQNNAKDRRMSYE